MLPSIVTLSTLKDVNVPITPAIPVKFPVVITVPAVFGNVISILPPRVAAPFKVIA